MSRVQYKITLYYSRETRTHLEDIADPAIEKVVSPISDLNQLDLQDDIYISVHDLNRKVYVYIGHFARQRIGDRADIDCTRRVSDIDLLIDGKVYDYPYIMDHFMEVKALIEDIRMEKVLNEI